MEPEQGAVASSIRRGLIAAVALGLLGALALRVFGTTFGFLVGPLEDCVFGLAAGALLGLSFAPFAFLEKRAGSNALPSAWTIGGVSYALGCSLAFLGIVQLVYVFGILMGHGVEGGLRALTGLDPEGLGHAFVVTAVCMLPIGPTSIMRLFGVSLTGQLVFAGGSGLCFLASCSSLLVRPGLPGAFIVMGGIAWALVVLAYELSGVAEEKLACSRGREAG